MSIGTPTLGTFTEAAAAATTAVPFPSTVNANDFCVMVGSCNSASLVTLPSGWTSQASFSSTGNTVVPDIFVATKYAAGTEGGTTVTVTHPNVVSNWQILAFSGVDQTTALDVAAQTLDNTTASTTSSMSGVTVVTANAAMIYAAALNSTAATSTPPTGYTETGDRSTGTRSSTVAYKLSQATGATGTVANTWTVSARSLGVLIALRPAVTAKTLADTGSGADVLSVAPSAPQSDTASGADALSVAATVATADTVAGSDALAVAPAVPLADTGSAADSLASPSVTAPQSDTAHGADALSVAATASTADTASGADALTVAPSVPLADVAHGTDAMASPSVTAPLSDVAGGVDSLTVTVTVALADTASGVDALTVAPPRPNLLLNPSFELGSTIATHWSDGSFGLVSSPTYSLTTGNVSDGVLAQRIQYTGQPAETGSGAVVFYQNGVAAVPGDTVTFSIMVSGSSTLTMTANIIAVDASNSFLGQVFSAPITLTGTPTKYTLAYTLPAGTAGVYVQAAEFDGIRTTDSIDVTLDAASLTSAAVPLGDSGTAFDALTAAVTTAVAETAAGSDVMSVSVTTALPDTAHGTDAVTVTAASGPADTVSGADALTITASTALGDVVSAGDALAILAALPLGDTGSAADLLAVAVAAAFGGDTATALDVLHVVASVQMFESAAVVDVLTVIKATFTPANRIDVHSAESRIYAVTKVTRVDSVDASGTAIRVTRIVLSPRVDVVPADNRTVPGSWNVPSFVKDPDAVLDYQVDWSAWLAGDTIASSAWTLDTGIVKNADTSTATTATIWLSGGTDGTNYNAVNRIVTAGGRTMDRTLTFLVRQA